MNKNAKELIEKMAFEKKALSPETVGSAMVQRMARTAPSKAQGDLGLSQGKEKLYKNNLSKRPAAEQERAVDSAAKTAPMMFKRSMIDDVMIRQLTRGMDKEADLKHKILGALAAGSMIAGAPGALKANYAQTQNHGATSSEVGKHGLAPMLRDNLQQSRQHGVTSSSKKEGSDMRSMIDDIIKGAKDNSFGRPVTIQADTDWTPLKVAEHAGALVALGEQGYTTKQAAEYLNLTEQRVEEILRTVG